MSKQIVPHSTITSKTNQTPFDRLKAAMSTVLSVPKSSLPSKATKKKPHKK
jgi:hypothetical protein